MEPKQTKMSFETTKSLRLKVKLKCLKEGISVRDLLTQFLDDFVSGKTEYKSKKITLNK